MKENINFEGIDVNMKKYMEMAEEMILDWKGDNYAFGTGEGKLNKTGEYARRFGKKALIVAPLGQSWAEKLIGSVVNSLESEGIDYLKILDAKPNAPREDVYRIAFWLSKTKSDMIIPIGGGSTIDTAKAGSILSSYSPSEVIEVLGIEESLASTIEPYFGMGNITKMKERTGKPIIPVIAIQTASSSAAHLTKYSNITDPVTGQKTHR